MTRTLFRRKKFRCLKPISPTSYWNDKNYEKRCGNDSTRCNSRDRQTQEVWILLHRRCATSNNNSIAMLSLWWASKLSWFSFSPSSLFFFFFNELCRDHRHQWMKTGKFKTHLISVGICITRFLFYKDLFFCSLSKVYYFLLKSSREFHMVNFTIAIQLIWFAFLMPDSDIFGHALFRNARRQTSSFF